MRQINLVLAGMAALVFAVGTAGCGGSATQEPSNTSQAGTDSKAEAAAHSEAKHNDHGDHASGDEHKEHGKHAVDHEHKEHGEHAAHADPEKVKANLAKLSDEDRAAAEKQKNCPVTGEALGAMGKPIKIHVKDTDVWICCAGCKGKLTSDPDTYLAKLKKE